MSFANLLTSFKAGAGASGGSKRGREDGGNESGNPSKKISLKSSSSSTVVLKDGEETAEMQGAPHYLILGAQKAGTMAAVKNLNKHPEIFCLKEPHYFDLGWHSLSTAQYRKEFQGKGKRICGEKTPELIYVDECAIRMKKVVSTKNAKFLLFLRDPIKRAYSAWNMNINRNTETSPFDEACERNFTNLNEFRSHGTAEYHYVQRGFYFDQIERFLKIFPNKNNFKIIIAEHMRDPIKAHDIYNEIFEFLGAKQLNTNEFTPEDEHVGTYNAKTPCSSSSSSSSSSSGGMSLAMELKLMKLYHSHNERLFKFLGFRIHEWTSLSGVNAKIAKKKKEQAEALAAATGAESKGEGEGKVETKDVNGDDKVDAVDTTKEEEEKKDKETEA